MWVSSDNYRKMFVFVCIIENVRTYHRPYTNRQDMVVVPASTRECADQGSTRTPHMRTRTLGLYNNF